MADRNSILAALLGRLKAMPLGWEQGADAAAEDAYEKFGGLGGGGFAGTLISKRLTPAERKFFGSLNEADLADLKSMVPSAKVGHGSIVVDSAHVPNLDTYLDDVVRLSEGGLLPPSFYSGKFTLPFRGPK